MQTHTHAQVTKTWEYQNRL